MQCEERKMPARRCVGIVLRRIRRSMTDEAENTVSNVM